MNLVVNNLLFHVFVVDSPVAFLILVHRVQNDVPAVVFDAACETDICRALQQDVVASGAENVQSGNDATKNGVVIADNLSCQVITITITCLVPVNDTVEIFFSRSVVAECINACTLDHLFLDRRECREVLVSNPHRDLLVLPFRLCQSTIRREFDGDSVFTHTVNKLCEIKLHN